MSKKIQVPESIRINLESAQSALIDADSLPGALQHNASRYFLLLSAWELAQITDEKLSTWISRNNVDPKLLKDHGYKLRKSPLLSYIKIVNGRPIVTEYASQDQKKELRKLLIYGQTNISRRGLFMRGWNFDTFRNRLIWKIEFLEVFIKAIEKLPEQ